jgi:hypothetical protein
MLEWRLYTGCIVIGPGTVRSGFGTATSHAAMAGLTGLANRVGPDRS